MVVLIHTFHLTNTKKTTRIIKNVLLNQAAHKGTWNVIWTVSKSHFYSRPGLYSLAHTKSTWEFPLPTIYNFSPLYYFPYGKPVHLSKYIWNRQILQSACQPHLTCKIKGEHRYEKKIYRTLKPARIYRNFIQKLNKCYFNGLELHDL